MSRSVFSPNEPETANDNGVIPFKALRRELSTGTETGTARLNQLFVIANPASFVRRQVRARRLALGWSGSQLNWAEDLLTMRDHSVWIIPVADLHARLWH